MAAFESEDGVRPLACGFGSEAGLAKRGLGRDRVRDIIIVMGWGIIITVWGCRYC